MNRAKFVNRTAKMLVHIPGMGRLAKWKFRNDPEAKKAVRLKVIRDWPTDELQAELVRRAFERPA